MSEYDILSAREGLIPRGDDFGAEMWASKFYTAQARIAELERQLESARSLAVDRDQRLARIAENIERADDAESYVESSRLIYESWRLALGKEEDGT